MKSRYKSVKKSCLLFIIVIVIIVGAIVFFKQHIAQLCIEVGEEAGRAVGTAVGSYEGYKKGKKEGTEKGEQAGLSAKDTKVTLQDALRSAEKLEVLSAGVTLRNLNQIGDTYKGLYIANGNVIFTVDLSHAEIQEDPVASTISVSIPVPEAQFYLDHQSTQKLAEMQKFSLDISAEDGLTAYLNSLGQSVTKVTQTIANYNSLMNLAKDSAITQVTQIVSAVDLNNFHVEVNFCD